MQKSRKLRHENFFASCPLNVLSSAKTAYHDWLHGNIDRPSRQEEGDIRTGVTLSNFSDL